MTHAKKRWASTVVKVDDSCRIRIPKVIRDELGIYIGQKLTVITRGHGLTLIPDVDIAEMKGAFPELSLEGIRDEDDRF